MMLDIIIALCIGIMCAVCYRIGFNNGRKADELRKAQEQIAEYKRLLKAAVEDLRWVNENTQDAYGTCIMKKCEGCGDCPLDINGDLWCKWKHEAEALALIGEDGDPE